MSEKRKSQKVLVLEYLQTHGSITPEEARRYCGKCWRLSERIRELMADGHPIERNSNFKDKKTGARYGKYFYQGDQQTKLSL